MPTWQSEAKDVTVKGWSTATRPSWICWLLAPWLFDIPLLLVPAVFFPKVKEVSPGVNKVVITGFPDCVARGRELVVLQLHLIAASQFWICRVAPIEFFFLLGMYKGLLSTFELHHSCWNKWNERYAIWTILFFCSSVFPLLADLPPTSLWPL